MHMFMDPGRGCDINGTMTRDCQYKVQWCSFVHHYIREQCI